MVLIVTLYGNEISYATNLDRKKWYLYSDTRQVIAFDFYRKVLKVKYCFINEDEFINISGEALCNSIWRKMVSGSKKGFIINNNYFVHEGLILLINF